MSNEATEAVGPHRQEAFKAPVPPTDELVVLGETTTAIRDVLARLVADTPGVVGALLASSDGFAVAEHLPDDRNIDPAGLAAMSAAALALSNQLAASNGPGPASVSHHISNDGQVMIVPIARVAVLTMLATATAEAGALAKAGYAAGDELQRLVRTTPAMRDGSDHPPTRSVSSAHWPEPTVDATAVTASDPVPPQEP